MTALLNAAHHALAHTAPIPEAAMFAAPWLVLLAWFVRPIARGAFWLIHGGPDSCETSGGWLDERAGVEVWHDR